MSTFSIGDGDGGEEISVEVSPLSSDRDASSRSPELEGMHTALQYQPTPSPRTTSRRTSASTFVTPSCLAWRFAKA